jgi:hypothetical protein
MMWTLTVGKGNPHKPPRANRHLGGLEFDFGLISGMLTVWGARRPAAMGKIALLYSNWPTTELFDSSTTSTM